MYSYINRNARPNNNQLITYYLCVRCLLRIQQYPINNTYNTFGTFTPISTLGRKKHTDFYFKEPNGDCFPACWYRQEHGHLKHSSNPIFSGTFLGASHPGPPLPGTSPPPFLLGSFPGK